jgi:hypothetical protein
MSCFAESSVSTGIYWLAGDGRKLKRDGVRALRHRHRPIHLFALPFASPDALVEEAHLSRKIRAEEKH